LETGKWRKEIFNGNCLVVNEVAYQRIIGSRNAVKLRNTGKCLHKVTRRWVNKINNIYLETEKRSVIIFIRIDVV
jgi:hypothetical protein